MGGYIFRLPVVEEFDLAPFHVRLHFSDQPNQPRYYATYRPKGANRRERGWWKCFSKLEDMRQFAVSELEKEAARLRQQHAESVAQSNATRARRKAEKIAAITRDYLLGKGISDRLNCAVCGKALSDPVSIERGLGSECWPNFMEYLARQVPHCEEALIQLRQRFREIGEETESEEGFPLSRRIHDLELLLKAATKQHAA